MIGLARSFSTTNQSRMEPSTQSRMASPRARLSDPVCTTPITAAQAPVIIRPSSPRCQIPAREARTPAIVT